MDLPTSFRKLPLILLCSSGISLAQDVPPDPFDAASKPEPKVSGGIYLQRGQVQKLTAQIKPALVAVRQIGRDGNRHGIGSGFSIDESGLIATNFHVIGEGRPIEVEFTDGRVFPVKAIHSFDRNFDLAVLRIDPKGKKIPTLKLGNSDSLKQGQIIVGFGSPLGLTFSVVSGVVSAIRKLDDNFLGDETPDFPMIQIAMPIEPGNSGGPIVNLDGEVIGLVNLRHKVKENLGFAIRSNDLAAILEKPNSVPMARWKTIGALDPRQWKVIMNGDWNQRGGVIFAKKAGSGFGGRTLCLSETKIPDGPFEIAVKVKLDDESGAAGLVFSSDSRDRHYGFYPSGGKLRLTRFDGPDVYSWNILEQLPVDSYLPGEWNRLRIRVDGDSIKGYVNGKEAISLNDDGLIGGKAGLCKFRQTEAEFREFRIGDNLELAKPTSQQNKMMDQQIETFLEGGNKTELLSAFSNSSEASREFLEQKAKEFEMLANQMRELKSKLHHEVVAEDLKKAIKPGKGKGIDLFEVSLQLARIDDPELDESHYRSVFDRLVNDAESYLGKSSGVDRVKKLRDFLFKENGFHGSRNEYYHHANSYINRVLDDREGLPITLSVLYIEMARRLKMDGVFGVPLPGQFLVGYQAKPEDDLLLIDVFDGGKELTRREAESMALGFGVPTSDDTFEASPPEDIAARMLRNLINLEIEQKKNPPGALGYLNLLLAVNGDSTDARFQRALIQVELKDFEGAKVDLDWLLEKRPEGINYQRLLQFREALP